MHTVFWAWIRKKLKFWTRTWEKIKCWTMIGVWANSKLPIEIIISFNFNFVVTNIFILNLLFKREKFLCEQIFDSSLRKKSSWFSTKNFWFLKFRFGNPGHTAIATTPNVLESLKNSLNKTYDSSISLIAEPVLIHNW
jgi:hypothetical protein